MLCAVVENRDSAMAFSHCRRIFGEPTGGRSISYGAGRKTKETDFGEVETNGLYKPL